MEKREPRKRIPANRNIQPAIDDPLEFKRNKCSDNARVATSINERIVIELWFDKHYIDRHQHGDDNGKRDGIDNAVVENLVLQSVKHLLFYSAFLKNFNFLNHNTILNGNRSVRIVCQKDSEENMLNVVIEAHYKSLNEYEITVKTAMRNNDFKISDGQYVIEILDSDSSELKLMAKNRLVTICAI